MLYSKELLKPICQNQTQIFQQNYKKQFATQFQFNEDDFDQIQNTSPTQHLVTDDSTLFNEQKRRCTVCIEIQKKSQTIEYQLDYQKKRNAKYLKIMNKRIGKQKELQQAYYQIAKGLKKKIEELSNYQRKQKQQKNATKERLRQIGQQDKKQNNKQHLVLESKNVNYQFLLTKEKNFKINCFQIIQQIIQSENKSLSQQQIQILKFLQNKQQTHRTSRQNIIQQQSLNSFYSIHNLNSLSKSFLQFAINRLNQKKQQSSYYSVSGYLSIDEISNVLMNNSISSQQNDRNVQKQFLQSLNPSQSEQFLNVLQCSFRQTKQQIQKKRKQVKQKDRQQLINFINEIKGVLDKLNKQLNTYGQRYSIYYPSIQLQAISNQSSPNQLWIQDALKESNINPFLEELPQRQEKIFRCFKRQYEKMLNDKELEVCDLRTKISDLQHEKIRYQQIIEKYQIHKTMQSIKILDLEQTLRKNKYKLPSQSVMTKMENKMVQCQIITTEQGKAKIDLQSEKRRLINAVQSTILNKINASESYRWPEAINWQNNLEEQLQIMITNCFNNLVSAQVSFKLQQQESKQISKDPNEDYKLIDQLQKENNQLKDILSSKSQLLLKCSQKISLQKMQKTKLDENIQNFTVQIQRLNHQLQWQKHNLPPKEYINVSSAFLQNRQFLQFVNIRQKNNMHWEREQELKNSKIKLQNYQAQLTKLKTSSKKNKKIVYINK